MTICDAKTMKVLKQITNISTDEKGKSNADGRGFLGVNEHKGYISTSNGIFILDLDNMEIKGSITGSDNKGGSAYDQLYSGQIGNMIRVNDRVFAVHQKDGLLVINPETDKVEKTIGGPDKWGYGSVVLSKDGNLWLSVSATSGSGQADNRIIKVNPATCDTTSVWCPKGIYGPANTWYAWTPDCFSASKQHNVLYWNGGSSSWFTGYTIYKYDIDKNEFSVYVDFTNDPDGWQIYGCSFRVGPVSDEAYISLYKGFGDPTYIVRKYDSAGAQTGEYSMISNYWFPSMPVFPDNEAPVVTNPAPVQLTAAETVSLAGIATDADNFDAAIVKSVKSVSDASILKAEMKDGDVVITPLSNGTAVVTISINSNGKLADADIQVSVSGVTGVNEVNANNDANYDTYTLDGIRTNTKVRGIKIIRMKDGTSRKVLMK